MSENTVAIVTGGTSGIGLAVTRLLASDGMSVFICSRHQEAIDRTLEEVHADDLEVDGAPCDVTSEADVKKFVQAAVDRYGPIDILVNNAGRSGGGVTAQLSYDLWLDIINTNLNSVFLVTREVLNTGRMLEREQGHIVNIASTAGKQGIALGAPYSASKHGVIGFTKSLGFELAKSGITVNAVCPGYVETPLAERVRAGYAEAWGVTTAEILERFNAKIPLGRYSTPDEVAGLVKYLTTPSAASITAQAMNVCGGLGNY